MDQIGSQEGTENTRKVSLRRVSISDTNLPKFDKSPISRYLGHIMEANSNSSVNKLGSTDSMDRTHDLSSDHEHEKPHFLKPTTLPTPTLKKSATTGFSLFGHYHEGAPVHLPEHKDDDIGLTMNISASPPTNHLPIPITTASLANEEKKTKLFNGFSSFFSFDNYFNKPVQVVKDREENYRLIMALDK